MPICRHYPMIGTRSLGRRRFVEFPGSSFAFALDIKRTVVARAQRALPIPRVSRFWAGRWRPTGLFGTKSQPARSRDFLQERGTPPKRSGLQSLGIVGPPTAECRDHLFVARARVRVEPFEPLGRETFEGRPQVGGLGSKSRRVRDADDEVLVREGTGRQRRDPLAFGAFRPFRSLGGAAPL